MKAAFLAAAVLAIAGVAFYFSTTVHAAKASGPGSAELKPAAHKTLPSKSLSLPLFFEPNQGQTAPQVKFLARGAGYGLFLEVVGTIFIAAGIAEIWSVEVAVHALPRRWRAHPGHRE